jgi:regulatory protein
MMGQMAGTITALKAQPGRARVNVYLDGKFAFGLALIHALWLKVGQSLSDDEIAALRSADSEEQACARALTLLAYRPRSVQEVRARLRRAGADEQTIARVVLRLQAAGLLSDAEFSQAWVESRVRARPRSKRAIAWELRQKGIAEGHITAALAAVNDEDIARRAAQKYWPRLQRLSPAERKRKLYAALARQGFEHHTIIQTIDWAESLQEAGGSTDSPDSLIA